MNNVDAYGVRWAAKKQWIITLTDTDVVFTTERRPNYHSGNHQL